MDDDGVTYVGVTYVTEADLVKRPAGPINLDGVDIEAGDLFTISEKMAVGEMDQPAPEPADVLRQIRILEARQLLQEDLDLEEGERDLIRVARQALAHVDPPDRVSVARLLDKLAGALGI